MLSGSEKKRMISKVPARRAILLGTLAAVLLLFNRSLPALEPAGPAAQEFPPPSPLARDYAGLCGTCHGERGISDNPRVPSLAGQDRFYLLGQLRAFRERRRHHAAMEGVLAKLIDEDSRRGIHQRSH